MSKPVVTYARASLEPRVGYAAIIHDLKGHPKQHVNVGTLEGENVYTSKVVRVGENGEFETLNTVYRKEAT